MKNFLIAFVVLVVVLAFSTNIILPFVSAAAPTPSPGAMTIYQVSNPNASGLETTHTFINALSTPVYTMNQSVPAVSTAVYHVKDIPQVVSPFNGSVHIEADMPFSAEVVDYDYPPTNTPTNTPTRTPTVTPTLTRTPTPTPTHVVIILPILK